MSTKYEPSPEFVKVVAPQLKNMWTEFFLSDMGSEVQSTSTLSIRSALIERRENNREKGWGVHYHAARNSKRWKK